MSSSIRVHETWDGEFVEVVTSPNAWVQIKEEDQLHYSEVVCKSPDVWFGRSPKAPEFRNHISGVTDMDGAGSNYRGRSSRYGSEERRLKAAVVILFKRNVTKYTIDGLADTLNVGLSRAEALLEGSREPNNAEIIKLLNAM